MNKATKWFRKARLAKTCSKSIPARNVHLLVLLAASTLVGCVAQAPAPAPAKKGKAATQFNDARQLVHHGKFEQATTALDAFLKSNPKHKLASRAVFLRAKCKMGLSDTEAAQLGFQDVIKQFPASEEARKAEFKLAMIEFLGGNEEEAHRQFSAIEQAANGPYTPEAAAWVKYLADKAKR